MQLVNFTFSSTMYIFSTDVQLLEEQTTSQTHTLIHILYACIAYSIELVRYEVERKFIPLNKVLFHVNIVQGDITMTLHLVAMHTFIFTC